MRKTNLTTMGLLGVALVASQLVCAQAMAGDNAKMLEEGKQLAFDRAKGNCLACHIIPGGESPGTIAPPLFSMKVRFPERDKLREQISNPLKRNPETSMPPFGKHRILSDAEIDKVVDFIWSL